MICERCKKKKVAVIHRILRSERWEVRHLCTACSEVLEATGELADISAALPPYTAPLVEEDGGCFPFFLSMSGEAARSCPLCGMTTEELQQEGRAGCPQCYTAFAEVILGATRVLHGTSDHKGRMPAAARLRLARMEKIAHLRHELQEAVKTEQYERAASLRDEIRVLSAGA